MKIIIGSDHAGYELKRAIIEHLKKEHQVIDVGTHSRERCDYPDYAVKAVKAYFQHNADFGILICGTGIGMSIVANKFKGIRAALVYNIETARMSRRHNHANFLCLGARQLSKEKAIRIVKEWLITGEEGGRHKRRINKIVKLEDKNFKEIDYSKL